MRLSRFYGHDYGSRSLTVRSSTLAFYKHSVSFSLRKALAHYMVGLLLILCVLCPMLPLCTPSTRVSSAGVHHHDPMHSPQLSLPPYDDHLKMASTARICCHFHLHLYFTTRSYCSRWHTPSYRAHHSHVQLPA